MTINKTVLSEQHRWTTHCRKGKQASRKTEAAILFNKNHCKRSRQIDCPCQTLTKWSSHCSQRTEKSPVPTSKSALSSPAVPYVLSLQYCAVARRGAYPGNTANTPKSDWIWRTTCRTATEHKMYLVLANKKFSFASLKLALYWRKYFQSHSLASLVSSKQFFLETCAATWRLLLCTVLQSGALSAGALLPPSPLSIQFLKSEYHLSPSI